MGLRRHRPIVVWSSSPGRPGALGFTSAPRSARIRWCFRTGGLLAVIGLLRVAAAFTQTWPEEVRARRRGLERELAAYCTPAQRNDLEATLDRYPDSATRELRDILAGQAMTAGRGRAG